MQQVFPQVAGRPFGLLTGPGRICGAPNEPPPRFSMKAIELMNRTGKPFEVINIFEDENIRPALISYSNWPTTPQVFIDGKFVGGCDITRELFASGELKKMVEAALQK